MCTTGNNPGANAAIVSATAYPSGSTTESYISLFWQDVLVLLKVIAPLGLVLSTVLGFGYLYVLRIPGLLFVGIWSILLSIQIVFIIFSILLYTLSTSWATDGMHSSGNNTPPRNTRHTLSIYTVHLVYMIHPHLHPFGATTCTFIQPQLLPQTFSRASTLPLNALSRNIFSTLLFNPTHPFNRRSYWNESVRLLRICHLLPLSMLSNRNAQTCAGISHPLD